MKRSPWIVVLGSLALTACPDDGGTATPDTDATGSGTDAGMTMSATQGPGTAGDDAQPTGGPDDGPEPSTGGPEPSTGDGATDDGTADDTTGPAGCSDDTDCGGTTPFCSGGACVDCSIPLDPDGACESLGAGTDFCVGGVCVQCTTDNASACEGETPLCDEGTLQCVGCSYHAQCDTGACNLDTGACMPGLPSVWVRPQAANCSDASSGTFALPFCELQPAIDYIEAQGDIGTIRMEEDNGTIPAATIPAGLTVAILAQTDQRPEIGGISALGSGAHVYLEGISVTGNILNAIEVNDASIWLDRVIVYNNVGYAADIRNDAALHMRNTVIGSNGRISNVRPAVYIENAAVDVQFTAIVANFAETFGVASLGCMNPTSATMRNSIAASNSGNSIDCPGLDVDYSWVDAGGLGGVGNVVDAMAHPDLSIWFIEPGGIADGMVATFGDDFRLTAAGEALFGPIGLVHEGDLPFDIDLDPRSTTIGDPTTAGAYLEAP